MLDLKNLLESNKSLILDFSNSEKIHPILTNNRSTIKTFLGKDGWKTVPANTPSLAYSDNKCIGLVTESDTRNMLMNSVLATNAGWGGSNLDITYNQPSPIPGANSASLTCRQTEIVTSKGLRQYVTGLTPNMNYTFSVYIKPDFTAAGSFTLRMRSALRNAGEEVVYDNAYWITFKDEQVGNNGARYIGDGWWHCWYVFKTKENTDLADIGLWFGDAVKTFQFTEGGYTMLISAPQIENGIRARSPLITQPNQTTFATNETNIIDVGQYISPNGFTVACVATSDFSSEYQLFFGTSKNTQAEYIGLRHSSGGSYINSLEGGRTTPITRPTPNTKVKSVASFSNDECCAIVNGLISNSNANTGHTVDYSTRRYMKLNQIIDKSLGSCVHERIVIWNRPMNVEELKSIYNALS